MGTSLESLPFDLMHIIASNLDIHDFVNLGRVSRRYHILLQNESISRKALQVRCYLAPRFYGIMIQTANDALHQGRAKGP
jgi:F-box domain